MNATTTSKAVFAATIALVLMAAGCQSVEGTRQMTADILKESVDKQNRAPGIVVGLIDKSGTKVVVARGKSGRGRAGEVDGDTIFEIGSITKVFTTLLLQDMVDRGEVRLDDPIGKFLPASVRTPIRDGREITLLDLATHTSGLPGLPGNLSPTDGDNPYADYTVEQMYQFLSTCNLTRKIGSKFEYSNFGMGLLGHVLALRAGTNYESLVVGRICGPLHMDSTRITLSTEMKLRLATGHSSVGPPVKYWDVPTLAGCGAFHSSANDLLKFLAANMEQSRSPLGSAMMKTQTPLRRSGFLQKVGLGWQIFAGIVWQNGGTGGFRSFIGFDGEGHGAVVLANSANDIDEIGFNLLGSRYNLHKFSPPQQRVAARIDHSVYDSYVGWYEFNAGQSMVITRDGDRLVARQSGRFALDDAWPYEVFPGSETEFFYTAGDAQIKFVRNEAGAVTEMIVHQDGTDRKAVKLK